jgi:dephospho-CoA kinase
MAGPLVIGLVGGVAAGKSTAAAEFARLGATVIDADAAGHEALRDEGVRAEIEKVFGKGVLASSGGVDRAALGAAVFGKPSEVKKLEAITHPWIRTRMRAQLDAAKRNPAIRAVVLDVSLLLESGAYTNDIDLLVFIESDAHTRESRATGNRHWNPGEVARRETHQLPLADKRSQAHEVLDNRGSVADLRDGVKRIWARHLAAAPPPG